MTRATTRATPNSVLANSDVVRFTLSSPVAAITTSHVCIPDSSSDGELARVGEQPVRVGNREWFVMPDVVLDQQDLVAVGEQFLATDRPTAPAPAMPMRIV